MRRLLRRRRIVGKKASIDDLLFGVAIVVFFSFMVLVGLKILEEFNSGLQDLDAVGQDAKDAASSVESKFPNVVDNTFLLLTIGMCVGILILAFMVRVHPIFLFFFLILMPIVIFLSGVFSNIYQRAADTAILSDTASRMVFMSHIVEFIPIIIGVMGFILAIVQYNTWRGESV